MSNVVISVEGILIRRTEGWIAPGVYDDNNRPEIRDIFELDYSKEPVKFDYYQVIVYGIYCCVRCDDPKIIPYLNGFLVRRRERIPIETKHTPMWQDQKYKNYYAYLYEWPSEHENWRDPLTYTFEMCLGYKGIDTGAGTKPTWLVKSCEEKDPLDTKDNPNKFSITISHYMKT